MRKQEKENKSNNSQQKQTSCAPTNSHQNNIITFVECEKNADAPISINFLLIPTLYCHFTSNILLAHAKNANQPRSQKMLEMSKMFLLNKLGEFCG